MTNLKTDIIDNDFCIGCGGCVFNEHNGQMKLNDQGFYVPDLDDFKHSSQICPFSNDAKNEDALTESLFSSIDKIHYEKYIGYSLSLSVGHVNDMEVRDQSSSGGLTTWLAKKLLEEKEIDYVVHLKVSSDPNILFDYQISQSIEEIDAGAKTKYYPSQMSDVLKLIETQAGRYCIIGVPCFIKSIRLLQEQHPLLKERIVYCFGLVCGHMKSTKFTDHYAMQLGINHEEVKTINFRKKTRNNNASLYLIELETMQDEHFIRQNNEFYGSNWGYGFFKAKACDYCDDVFAECADATFGDAWLPEYIKDDRGSNILILRNQTLKEMVQKFAHELTLNEVSAQQILESQDAGLRHRTQGLSYRLYLDQSQNYLPQKRVKASNEIPQKRKRIYEMRIDLREKSHSLFIEAQKRHSFEYFKQEMLKLTKKYDELFKQSFIQIRISQILKILKDKL